MISRVWVTVIALLLATTVNTRAEDRFVTRLKLQTGETVVVAEGDFEARSIGSFSVRLYAAAEPLNETTFYTSGLIHPRDGVVEDVVVADIDGDLTQEIVVIARSAGSGGYLSAYAFTAFTGRLRFLVSAEGLAADADPVSALQKSVNNQR